MKMAAAASASPSFIRRFAAAKLTHLRSLKGVAAAKALRHQLEELERQIEAASTVGFFMGNLLGILEKT